MDFSHGVDAARIVVAHDASLEIVAWSQLNLWVISNTVALLERLGLPASSSHGLRPIVKANAPMLCLMSFSQRRIDSGSECVDGITHRCWLDVRFQRLAVHNIDRPVKQAGDISLDPSIFPHTDRCIGIDLDQDIGVAIGPRVATCARAEQHRMRNATRPQGRFVLP
jgi:hypothetical protein